MRNLKTSIALCAVLDLIAAAGCSSSSSSPNNAGKPDASAEASTDDGGTDNDADDADDGADGPTCNPTSPDNGCAGSTTCCFDLMAAFAGGIGALSSGLKGACSDPTACTAPIQVKCLTSAGCAAGQVCCVSGSLVGGGDAGPPSAAGGIGALTSLSAVTTCQQSCPAGQTQACTSASQCTGLSAGFACTPAQLGALGGAGGEGGAGGLGMLAAGLLGGLATEMVCTAPDGGTTVVDAGPPDSATPEAGPVDAGQPADAGDSGATDAPTGG